MLATNSIREQRFPLKKQAIVRRTGKHIDRHYYMTTTNCQCAGAKCRIHGDHVQHYDPTNTLGTQNKRRQLNWNFEQSILILGSINHATTTAIQESGIGSHRRAAAPAAPLPAAGT